MNRMIPARAVLRINLRYVYLGGISMDPVEITIN